MSENSHGGSDGKKAPPANIQSLPSHSSASMSLTTQGSQASQGFVEYLLPLAETYRRVPRRVGPWIDREEFLPEERPSLRLNDPSEPAIRQLHIQAWVQRLVAVLDKRLCVALERPAVRHQRADGRGHAVVVMFGGVIEVEGEHIRRASLVPLEPHPTPWRESTLPSCGELLDLGELSVSPSPWGDRWLFRYIDAVYLVIKDCAPDCPDDVAWRYTTWLFVQMRRRHWGPAARQRVRATVAEALGLNAWALHLAQQVRPVFSRQPHIQDSLYQLALNSLIDWTDVHRAAPNLLPLYALVKDELNPNVEPLAALRAWVLDPQGAHGALKPRFWRWLHRFGTRWLADLRECLHGFSPAAVRGALTFVAAFEFEGPASPGLLRAVARLYGNPNGPGRSPAAWYRSKALLPLARWWHRADGHDRQELVAWAPALANWLADRVSPDEAAALARRSWRKAKFFMEVDAAREISEVERTDENTTLRGSTDLPIDGLQEGRMTLHVLKRSVDIVKEGHEMNHCARQYLPDCRAGAAVMATVTEFRRSRICVGTCKVATVLLRPGSKGWRVDEIAGRSNAEVSQRAMRLARKACKVLDAHELELRSNAAVAMTQPYPPHLA